MDIDSGIIYNVIKDITVKDKGIAHKYNTLCLCPDASKNKGGLDANYIQLHGTLKTPL